MSKESVDNEGHAQALEGVTSGELVMLSDEELPGGRFQVVGAVQGGEIVLSDWWQDADGDWHSRHCMFIKRGKLPLLAKLVQRTGFHLMEVCRED
jgi:hypothetical protein